MKAILNIIWIVLLQACTTKSFSNNSNSLEGQQWTLEHQSSSLGIGSGDSWTFHDNHRFTAINWYSGGAYWTKNFSGTYRYNVEDKTVYLKYDKNNTSKETVKQQLQLIIINNDTILNIKNDWKKSVNKSLSHNTKFPKIGNTIFKIEYITGEK